MNHQPIIIIGSGQAGVSLARELRKKCADTPITIVTQDAGGFYSKPMLSNAFCKKLPLERLKMQTAEVLAEKTSSTVLAHHSVTAIDTTQKQITLHANDTPDTAITLEYQKLIIATGGAPFKPAIEGIEHTQSINHLDHYLALRAQLEQFPEDTPARIAIIGGGLVGSELANDLHLSGATVSVIEREAQLLPRITSSLVSNALLQAFNDTGIQTALASNVTSIIAGTNASTQQPEYELTLEHSTNGTTTQTANIVISALGLRADTTLAQQAGLKIHHGLQCNRQLQTSNPDIYGIGDCVEIDGLVLPYIMPIMEAAKALAATLTGEPTEIQYPCMPVAVKTTAYPMVVCPPKHMSEDIRQENITEEQGLKTLFYKDEQLVGFSLGGTATQERQTLASQTLGLLLQ